MVNESEVMVDIEKIHYKKLPPRSAFYSKLKLEGISKEDYEHAQNVYEKFKCKSF